MGLTRCNVDQAIFYHHSNLSILIMAVHIDDCTIAAHPPELVVELKEKLGSCIEVTNLCKLHWLLGIEIARDCHTRCIAVKM